MSIPLLEYNPTSQNQRVIGFEVPGDENPRIYSTETAQDPEDMDALITAAYRQVFHEQQMLQSNRQTALESQLRAGQLTVRDFIRGLASSDAFRRLNYDVNNNYRFVEMCIQRILGRSIYNDRERLAWSVVLATQGLNSFLNTLISSAEYEEAFGDAIVPFQRRRVLPQHNQGEQPFERMARYGIDYRDRLPAPTLSTSKQVGLFDAFEPFSFDLFVKRSNWAMVSALMISLVGIVIFLLLIAATSS